MCKKYLFIYKYTYFLHILPFAAQLLDQQPYKRCAKLQQLVGLKATFKGVPFMSVLSHYGAFWLLYDVRYVQRSTVIYNIQ